MNKPLVHSSILKLILHQLHRARIDLEEMRTNIPSRKPKDVLFREAIEDLETRPIYIRRKPALLLALLTMLTRSQTSKPCAGGSSNSSL